MKKRALLSVSDKTGVVEFAHALTDKGWELLSTGGTFATLKTAGMAVTPVEQITGFPEMMDGRVKTLHPAVHGGILARRGTSHMDELAAHSFGTIDLVCVNLYPFRETVARGAPDGEVIENIDIGGPAMIRSAAKNHESVLIVVDPADYSLVLDEPTPKDRRYLAAKAYAHISAYDAAITAYLSQSLAEQPAAEAKKEEALLPEHLTLSLSRVAQVRYGENPHQAGAIYRLGEERGALLDAQLVSGKPMSFNNYADADAAYSLCQSLSQSEEGVVCVAVKHANPCGVAVAADVSTAWERARDADTLSVFGGVVALSAPVDLAAAQSMKGTFLEVLIAPEVTEEAAAWFAKNKPDLRVLVAADSRVSRLDIRPLLGGFAIQERDTRCWDELCPEVVSGEVTEQQWKDLRFAWGVVKGARSNAIAVCRNGVTVGLGAGAVSRIWAAERAILNAGEKAQGAVLASEAFFPFDDVVRLAASKGISAIIQPGGAKRDPEVIAACRELGLSMVLTGSRHFRH